MHLAEFNCVGRPYSISLALLAAALACASCGAAPAVIVESESGEGPPQESATAPETTEALIELGEFNAENDEFVLFNPCTEIPWEVYEEVGFVETFGEPHYDLGGSVSCNFKSGQSEHSEAFFVVTADEVPYQRIIDRGLMLNESPPSALPGVYTHSMGGEVVDSCTAAVHTTKGRLTLFASDRTLTDQQNELCEIAIEYLEKIHQHSAGV